LALAVRYRHSRSPWSDKDMKIAQVAPLMESVPPRLYGGTERIVSYLTDELVRLGHEVTLFASADSITAAELVGCASSQHRKQAQQQHLIQGINHLACCRGPGKSLK
jgi:hypothetical protein